MKLNRLGCLPLGNRVSYSSSLTLNKSFKAIVRWLSTSFVQLCSILVFPSNLILKLKIVMHEIHTAWMTMVIFISLFLHRCFESIKWLITLLTVQPNMWQYHAKIRVVEYALTCVSIGAGMAYVVNVEEGIKHEKRNCATLLLKLAVEKDIAVATQRVEAAAWEGHRPLPSTAKRTAQSIIDLPCFHRCYVWSNSDIKQMLPSALDSESAIPLPSPHHTL